VLQAIYLRTWHSGKTMLEWLYW